MRAWTYTGTAPAPAARSGRILDESGWEAEATAAEATGVAEATALIMILYLTQRSPSRLVFVFGLTS